VVDQLAVLEVLAGVGEVQAPQLGVAAAARVLDAGELADQAAAERHLHVAEPGVPADPELDVLGLHRVGVPLGQRDEGQLRAVARSPPRRCRRGGGAGLLQDQRHLGERADLDVGPAAAASPPLPTSRITTARPRRSPAPPRSA
jgi:hypothetical protein